MNSRCGYKKYFLTIKLDTKIGHARVKTFKLKAVGGGYLSISPLQRLYIKGPIENPTPKLIICLILKFQYFS